MTSSIPIDEFKPEDWVLLIQKDNYIDDFNTQAFWVIQHKEWLSVIENVKVYFAFTDRKFDEETSPSETKKRRSDEYCLEHYFGLSESLDWKSLEDYISSFTLQLITPTFASELRRHFQDEEFGIGYLYDDNYFMEDMGSWGVFEDVFNYVSAFVDDTYEVTAEEWREWIYKLIELPYFWHTAGCELPPHMPDAKRILNIHTHVEDLLTRFEQARQGNGDYSYMRYRLGLELERWPENYFDNQYNQMAELHARLREVYKPDEYGCDIEFERDLTRRAQYIIDDAQMHDNIQPLQIAVENMRLEENYNKLFAFEFAILEKMEQFLRFKGLL